MKRLTFTFLIMFLVSLGYSQNPTLPLDFEAGITYSFTDFDGGASTVISNPQSSGINTTANVAQMVKSTGQPWGGSWILLDGPIDFSTNKIFKVKVYSPRAGARLLLKAENETDGNIFFEREATVSAANTWEELTYDFSSINTNNTYSKLVFIFDLGVMGDGSPNFTFLYDEIQLVNGGTVADPVELPITFDDSNLDYGLTDFGGNSSTIIADPAGGTNKVVRSIKTIGAETWAGTTVGEPSGFGNPIPFTASETKMTVRVYAPAAGIPVRMKVEDAADDTKSVETEATTTVAGAWETLEFDFSNEASGTAALNLAYTYNLASMFFYFGTNGAGAGADTTFYWDDVMFGPLGTSIQDLKDLGLTYYPNPVNSELVLRADARIDEAQVFNLVGQQMMRVNVNNTQHTLDLSGLTPGAYLVKVTMGETQGTFKVLKY